MDQNIDPSHSSREQGQPRQHRQQQAGGGPPPEAPPPRGPPGGQPSRQGPPTQGQPPQQQGHHAGGHSQRPPQQQPRGTSPPPQQGHQSQQGMGGQPGPSHQQGRQSQRGPQSQQGMGGQQIGGPGGGGQQAMPPQQGTGSQGMGGPGMGGQRQLPVEPVGAEKISPDDVVSASRDDPLTSVIEKMDDADVGTVVITEDDRPVGLVTDRQVTLTLQDPQDVSEMTAEDVMTEDPITITRDTNFFDALRAMGGSGVRRAPVVDDDGSLVGIVSVDDAIVLLAEELNQVSDVIETQIERL